MGKANKMTSKYQRVWYLYSLYDVKRDLACHKTRAAYAKAVLLPACPALLAVDKRTLRPAQFEYSYAGVDSCVHQLYRRFR